MHIPVFLKFLESLKLAKMTTSHCQLLAADSLYHTRTHPFCAKNWQTTTITKQSTETDENLNQLNREYLQFRTMY
ncbi:hypothetical protein TW80_12195 [Loktanella sp. S4079]|nr:hypothetical protein TW80_12195 [Loktanella sp. S4079]